MAILLSRDNFREGVFKRDKHTCVICKEPGVDAHHILDRKLFEDGGYYLDNGATVCTDCHIKAEKCELTVEEIRAAAGITNIILPDGLQPGIIYDKWGNPEAFNTKYGRSLHAQISLGTTSDDRFMPDGYLDAFLDQDLVLTEKLDGQNDSFNEVGVYARSHAAPTEHAWDKPMVDIWKGIKDDLGDLELFGESMYAVHSIEYKELEHHYYLFGVRQNGLWLSWKEIKEWAELFGFPTVPEIPITVTLRQVKDSMPKANENDILREWLRRNLGMSWEEYVETGGSLGGFDPTTENQVPCCEGFVIRKASSYKMNNGILPVMTNEFDSLFKLVRKKHVKTDVHWTKNWRRAKLKWEF